jgi:SAM-dependent methyltransferase
MKASLYEVEAEVEGSHWWFLGRRKLFAHVLSEADLRGRNRALDIGTSTGNNLHLLRQLDFAEVVGVDFSENALRFCRKRGLGRVVLGDAQTLPFSSGSFDVVLATDVIEHLDDDLSALKEIDRVLAPGGRALITVPAFQSLWGAEDDRTWHKRRYRLGPLVELVARSGLRLITAYYFNYLLFVPIWAARRVMKHMGVEIESDSKLNAPLLNSILAAIFSMDVVTAPRLHPPFGVSILCLAEASGGAALE